MHTMPSKLVWAATGFEDENNAWPSGQAVILVGSMERTRHLRATVDLGGWSCKLVLHCSNDNVGSLSDRHIGLMSEARLRWHWDH